MPMCQCVFVASREIALYPVVRVKRYVGFSWIMSLEYSNVPGEGNDAKGMGIAEK